MCCRSLLTLCVISQRKDVGVGAKPATVKTHLRNMLVVPEMIGSVVGVYNGKSFTQVEVKVRTGICLAPHVAVATKGVVGGGDYGGCDYAWERSRG